MPKPLVTVIDKTTDPAQRLRNEWAASLREHMDGWFDQSTAETGMSRKRLQAELANLDIEVSFQAVCSWLTGAYSPRAHHQAAISKVLGVPVRRLFPIEMVA